MIDGTSSSAALKVLSVSELLEAILLELPNRNVLALQRVNKKFKATAAQSIRIQQKLFFKRPPSGPDGLVAINPLLKTIFNRCFPEHQICIRECIISDANKALLTRKDLTNHFDSNPRINPQDHLTIELNPVDESLAGRISAPSSYSQMLVADSPVNIEIRNPWRSSGRGFTAALTTISNANEDTIRTIGEVLKKCYAQAYGLNL